MSRSARSSWRMRSVPTWSLAAGYRACKIGNEPEWRPRLRSAVGLDTAELFAFIEETQASGVGEARQSPRRRRGACPPQVRPAAGAADRRAGDGRCPAARRPRPERRDPALIPQARLRGRARAGRPLRRQPADGHPPAPLRPGLQQDDRPLPVPQRHPGRDGGAEEPPHRPEHRARDRAVPHRPRSEERHARAAGARPLRRRPRFRRDDDQAGGQGDALPAVQPRPQPRQGQPAEPRRPQDLLPLGAGLGQGRLARHPPPLHPRRASREGVGRRAARGREGHLPALPPVGRGAQARGRRRRQRRRPLLPHPALGRVGQVQHDRLDGAPPLDPAQRRGPQGLRQGRRDHRPGHPRPPAPGHDLPVRARPRRRREDRRGLHAARRGAGGRAGAHHHHHPAEVPLRPRQDRRACRPATTRSSSTRRTPPRPARRPRTCGSPSGPARSRS